jgi:hypothetical protein
LFLGGVLHGLGPDHLAAITTYGAASGGRLRGVSRFALRFALGHAAVLALFAGLGQFAQFLLPASWQRGFEILAAGLLLVSGTGLMLAVASGRLVFHSHPHDYGEGKHGHLHGHLGKEREHKHSHGALATSLGALFALGGVRSLAAVAPVAFAETAALSLLRIGVFALGIVLAMAAFGALAGGTFYRVAAGSGDDLRTARGRMRLACLASGGFAMVAGVALLASVLEG